jgi:predicted lipoprotein with Yx(FWY)xxD motif
MSLPIPIPARLRRRGAALAAAAAVAALAAACGSGAASPGASHPAASMASSAHPALNVSQTGLGRVIASGSGHTLYLFASDTAMKSTCSGACLHYWPAYTGKLAARAGSGIEAKLVGAIHRPDGTRQVTYAGHPLYTYVGDTRPGQTTGEGLDDFGARWYALAPAGSPVQAAPAPSAGY